jgi:hypothetical protein
LPSLRPVRRVAELGSFGISMAVTFQSSWWQLAVPPPWKAEECEECVEITQAEGIGALHISGARKADGSVLDAEVLSQLQENCPEAAAAERTRCGDFEGYLAEYVDWAEGTYWKKWFVACRKVLLFITYTCKRGEEDLESTQASALLSSLRCRE